MSLLLNGLRVQIRSATVPTIYRLPIRRHKCSECHQVVVARSAKHALNLHAPEESGGSLSTLASLAQVSAHVITSPLSAVISMSEDSTVKTESSTVSNYNYLALD